MANVVRRPPFIGQDGLCHLPLQDGSEVLCDADRFDLIKGKSWSFSKNNIQATDFYKNIKLKILLYPEIDIAIFANGNKKDYRRENIEEGKRQCYIEGNICYVPMANDRMAMCDAKDFDLVKSHNWFLDKGLPYMEVREKPTSLPMLLGRPNRKYIHISDNHLDCRECNMANKSHYTKPKHHRAVIVYRQVYVEENLCIVPLQDGNKVICDIIQYAKIKDYKWYMNNEHRVSSVINGKTVSLLSFLFPDMACPQRKDTSIWDYTSKNVADKRMEFIIEGAICYAYTKDGCKIICDAVDYDKVRGYSWNKQKRYPSDRNYKWSYLMACMSGKTIVLHKYLFPEIKHADHINRNIYDNRRENIREAGNFGNAWNQAVQSKSKTGYKGVAKRLKRYQACIQHEHKRITIGTFDTPEEAARAYDKMANELFKEFAWLNFPEEYGRTNGLDDSLGW